MSYYAAFDGELGDQVATNSGWHGFARWARALSGLPALLELADAGETERLEELAADLRRALEVGSPSPDQRVIAEGILEMLADQGGASSMMITQGFC